MSTGTSQEKTQRNQATKAHGAFLGAAVGDALGWPQEDRARRVDQDNALDSGHGPLGFRKWVRRAGGRFYAHHEAIMLGEYSDDTQLLLCTARSLLLGRGWWRHFSGKELPTWSLYERGAGGATKRALEAWLVGRSPWSSQSKRSDRQRYFDAGGNGVAMRIMPHCLIHEESDDFTSIARSILENGICTHGHPRALVGALAYGFAVSRAFRQRGTLPYGRILDETVAGRESWSVPVLDQDLMHTWWKAAEQEANGNYWAIWNKTVKEMEELLAVCGNALKQGALSVDHEVMTKLGCFDRKVNGAGTVTAAASIYLASQYAADPLHGLNQAAFAEGADTDTLASMTGGILGAIHGSEWLGEYAMQVQDREYLTALAEDVVQPRRELENDGALPNCVVKKAQLDAVLKAIKSSKKGDAVSLPDGRIATISESIIHAPRSQSTFACCWRLLTKDGQTLYVRSISRKGAVAGTKEVAREVSRPLAGPGRIDLLIGRIGVKLEVNNLAKARAFYEGVLQLKVSKETPRSVNLADVIVLVPADGHEDAKGRDLEGQYQIRRAAVICIETRSLDFLFDSVRRSGTSILQGITPTRGRGRLFRCYDPDGNVVEVFEAPPSQ